jgi:hypothetical protein
MPQPTGLKLFAGAAAAVARVFGEPFTLTRAGDVPVEGRGVFDGRHFEVQLPGGEIGVSDYQVALSCRRDVAGDVREGDRVAARGAAWKVTDVRPDSEGFVVLALARIDTP